MMPFLRPLAATMVLCTALTSAGLAAAQTSAAPAVSALPGAGDADMVARARHRMQTLVAYMKTRPDLFPAAGATGIRVMTAEQRREVHQLWAGFLDAALVLDSVSQKHAQHRALAEGRAGRGSFRIGLAAYLSRYRHALEFIALTDDDPALRIALDEAVSEIGLPARTYADFKLRHLNALIATEFAALSAQYRVVGEDDSLPLTPGMRDDIDYLWKAGGTQGVGLTLSNAGQVVQGTGFRAYFPLQKGVAEWMGDTRVLHGKNFLVQAAQIAQLAPQLRPGDVLLERREWYLSNIGLPGYWPHAALYIGSPEERAAWLDDPEVTAWARSQGAADGRIDTLLRQRHPAAYAQSLRDDAEGQPHRILEAISEGVSFTSVAHSAGADAVAVLRPRLSRLALAQAVVSAFGYHGRPYDFEFDFRTDAALVCTELIYKAYGVEAGKAGLRFPLRRVAGRPVTTANDIARQFDEGFGGAEQQFDLVVFMDGQARTGQAEAADLARFRASWRRPKWHILTQGTPLARR